MKRDSAKQFRSVEELTAGLDAIRAAPADAGLVELIVLRPGVDRRTVAVEARLDVAEGVVGDGWKARGSRHTADGSAHPDMQVTLMGARAAGLVAGPVDRWPLAGDQFYVDLDLSELNLPAGTRLLLGSAVIEVADVPHLGCKKFAERFGAEATQFVNSPKGRSLRLRGVNARVIQAGVVCKGDRIRKK